MEDIKDLTKKYTRSEFENYFESEMDNDNSNCVSDLNIKCNIDYLCAKYEGNCIDCMKEATKDIKFKDDTEKPLVKVGVVEFYENGIVKFPENNNKTWMQQAMEHVEPVIREELKKAISNYMEGEKMENKTIKVRCINTFFDNLTIGKEYPVIEDAVNGYVIKGDDDKIHVYAKDMFEKVEDVLMVECIDNDRKLLNLTPGKQYPVISEDEIYYKVKNDYGLVREYDKSIFKPVEQQKEYSVIELLDFPAGTQFKYDSGIVKIVEFEKGNKGIEVCEGSDLILSTAWKKTKFTLVEEPKPVSTAEAFKALEEGKVIESLAYNCKYKKNDRGNIVMKEKESEAYSIGTYLNVKEIEGQWIIKGGKQNDRMFK